MALKAEPRFRKRVPCRLWVGKSSYSGIVLNLSRQGMFIQTRAGIKAGGWINMNLRGEIEVQVQVVWRSQIPRALHSAAGGGVGVHIVGAAEGYYELLVEAAGLQI